MSPGGRPGKTKSLLPRDNMTSAIRISQRADHVRDGQPGVSAPGRSTTWYASARACSRVSARPEFCTRANTVGPSAVRSAAAVGSRSSRSGEMARAPSSSFIAAAVPIRRVAGSCSPMVSRRTRPRWQASPTTRRSPPTHQGWPAPRVTILSTIGPCGMTRQTERLPSGCFSR
jgi:hypothetical protein